MIVFNTTSGLLKMILCFDSFSPKIHNITGVFSFTCSYRFDENVRLLSWEGTSPSRSQRSSSSQQQAGKSNQGKLSYSMHIEVTV